MGIPICKFSVSSPFFREFCFLFRENKSRQKRAKMKLFFVLALVVMSFGGLNAAVIPEDMELTAAKRGILADDEIAKIILEVVVESEAYGIMDIITHLPGLIADLKPVLAKYASIILDPSLSVSEKVTQIWEHTKDSMVPIIKVVGKTAAKEILKQLVIAAAAALGR